MPGDRSPQTTLPRLHHWPGGADLRPGAHLCRAILVDQTTIEEGAQDRGSHARLHVGKRRRVESEGGMNADARRIVRDKGWLEAPVNSAAVEMVVLVQAGAEPVDEGDRTDPGIDRTAGAMLAQAAFHHC
jgi:hypothetical protein